jgi:3-oxoacyl-[acyl-carrier protein] reductase
MQLGLSGKVAMVSGGSRGIGRAIVETLADEGCDVVVLSRTVQPDDPDLADVAKRTGRRLATCAVDLRSPEGAARSIAVAEALFGRLDILVNNAGDTKRGDFFELTDQDWESGFALKFFGYVRLTRAAWPLLKAAQGSVVNIIGVSARTPEAVYAIAASSNAALLAFTKSMAAIGVQDGVRVNAVNPGVIETDRLRTVLKNMGLPDEEARARLLQTLGAPRFGAPEDIAAMVAFLASGKAAYVQGALIDVDGGRTRGL